MRNRIIGIIVMVVLFSMAFFVQGEPAPFDPNNPTAFDYTNGDYSTIKDWSQVNWASVNYNSPTLNFNNIPAAYHGSIDVTRVITANRGSELTSEILQVQLGAKKLDGIDLTKFDPENIKSAIKQETGVLVVEFHEGAQIKGNVFQATFGHKETIDLQEKNGWEITVAEDGRVLVNKPQEINEETISEDDSFTILSEKTFIPSNQEGRKVKVAGVSFSHGSMYIREGKVGVVDGMDVTAKSNVDVYFTEEVFTSPEDYISTTNKKQTFVADKGSFSVKINPENRLFEEGDLGFTLNPNSMVTVEENGDKPPIMSAIGDVTINNGKNVFTLESERMRYSWKEQEEGDVSGKKSVPFEFAPLRADGTQLDTGLWGIDGNIHFNDDNGIDRALDGPGGDIRVVRESVSELEKRGMASLRTEEGVSATSSLNLDEEDDANIELINTIDTLPEGITENFAYHSNLNVHITDQVSARSICQGESICMGNPPAGFQQTEDEVLIIERDSVSDRDRILYFMAREVVETHDDVHSEIIDLLDSDILDQWNRVTSTEPGIVFFPSSDRDSDVVYDDISQFLVSAHNPELREILTQLGKEDDDIRRKARILAKYQYIEPEIYYEITGEDPERVPHVARYAVPYRD